MPKHLSIIITHYCTPKLLYLCLKSIRETLKNLDYEIIVVDSQSKQRIKWQKTRVIPFKKNVGYSKIVNAGLKKTKGEYILIINADITVLKNTVSEMLKFMKKNPDVGIVAPQLMDFKNNIQISCFAKPSLGAILARRTPFGKTKWGKKILKSFTLADWDRKTTKEVDWAQGSALMLRKRTLQKVGLLDERFFMYFEDIDWCQRFWEKGYKVVYLPKAKMKHFYHRSSKKWGPILDILFNKHTRTHIISALKYFWKYRHVKKT
jgi:GT2 family glycosyltransferase